MDRRALPALVVALALLSTSPAASQDLSSLFRDGMAAIEDARRAGEDRRAELLDEAIAAFREMLVVDPTLVRVRLELARAFFLKGEDRLARRHFETVLAGDVPQEVAANVRRFLAEIRARRRWDLHAGFAFAPDTNIGRLRREGHLHRRRRGAASLHPRRGGADDLGHRPLGVDRRRIPASALAAVAASAPGAASRAATIRAAGSTRPSCRSMRVPAGWSTGTPRRACWRAPSGAGAPPRRTTTPSGPASRRGTASPAA